MFIFTAILSICILVFVHEGGHFLASKVFGIRVSEFMLGLPGPSISHFYRGTKFGITCIPLGGYARVCGMTSDPLNPHLKDVLNFCYKRGKVSPEIVANNLNITIENAQNCLEELSEWGSLVEKKENKSYVYLTPRSAEKNPKYREGDPRIIDNIDEFYQLEYSLQYRSKPFWQRSIVLLAGIFVNIVVAFLLFIIVFSILGIDVSDANGNVKHVNLDIIQAIQSGINYLVMTCQAVINLFNPEKAAQTVSNSSSIVGIAILSGDYFSKGLAQGLLFLGMISMSLGVMNLLPIPPLDGGKFLLEVISKIIRREIPEKVNAYLSSAGVVLFLLFFLFMLNQDIQRFFLGNW